KEARLTVTLAASNFAGPTHQDYRLPPTTPASLSEYKGFGSDTRRSVSLRVAFRFGSLNASVKKTAASITNDDLQGRKKE
ncbi:MAG: hypothetical protein K2I61_01830, partial [Muribaculaceae bacterium]|nr:hypothetical protein [Muribaculaceae bacterium]